MTLVLAACRPSSVSVADAQAPISAGPSVRSAVTTPSSAIETRVGSPGSKESASGVGAPAASRRCSGTALVPSSTRCMLYGYRYRHGFASWHGGAASVGQPGASAPLTMARVVSTWLVQPIAVTVIS